MLFIVIEEEGVYSGLDYKIIGAYTSKDHAYKVAASLKYKNKLEREIATIEKSRSPKEKDYVIVEVVPDQTDDAPFMDYITESPLSDAEKEVIRMDLKDRFEGARRKQREEMSKKDAAEEAHVRELMRTDKTVPSHMTTLRNLTYRVALRTRDAEICKWVIENVGLPS